MRLHRTDGVSLSFGLIFLAVVAWWGAAQVVDVHLPAVGWLVAGALIVLGVVGLTRAIRFGHRADVVAPEPVEVAEVAAVAGPVRSGLPDSDLPPELHADIVRELLESPADRLPVEPVTAPPAPTAAPPAPPVGSHDPTPTPEPEPDGGAHRG